MTGHVDSTLLVLLILAGTDHTNSLVPAAMLKEPAGRYPNDVATCRSSLSQLLLSRVPVCLFETESVTRPASLS